jgi:hypothetical protein
MTSNIQVSSKDAHGRIFVIGGETFDSFWANAVDILTAEKAQQLVDDFQLLTNPEAANAVANAAPLRTGGTPVPAQPSGFGGGGFAPPGAPTCDHGPRVRRTGTSGKGPWVGWFCPTPKGTPGQCQPKFGD